MKKLNGLLILLVVYIGGCTEETPKLDIEGVWVLDYGFESDCEVKVSFSEQYLTMIFNDLSEGACWTDGMPIDNGVWPWEIEARVDGETEEGFRSVELEVYDATSMISATVMLVESETGLIGFVPDFNDPFAVVPQLLTPEEINSQFPLTADDDSYLPGLLGHWWAPCSGEEGGSEEDVCADIEFASATQGTTYVGGGCSSDGECTGEYEDFTYVVKSVIETSDNVFSIDAVILIDDPTQNFAIEMLIENGEMTMTVEDESVVLTRN